MEKGERGLSMEPGSFNPAVRGDVEEQAGFHLVAEQLRPRERRKFLLSVNLSPSSILDVPQGLFQVELFSPFAFTPLQPALLGMLWALLGAWPVLPGMGLAVAGDEC